MSNGTVYDCIVLGAGIAGVTAARNLQQQGLEVLLIEGSDRVGGRMHSLWDRLPDPRRPGAFLPLEAGAEYIHVPDKPRYREFWDELRHHGFVTSKFPKTTIFHGPGAKARNRLFFTEWGETRTTDQALKTDGQIREASVLLPLLEGRDLFDPDKDRDEPARHFARKQGLKGRGLKIAEYTLSAHTPGVLADPPPDVPPGQPNPSDTISVAGILKDEIQDQLMEPAEWRLEEEQGGVRKPAGFDALPRRICDELTAAGGTLLLSDDHHDRRVTKVERGDGWQVKVTTAGGETFLGRTALVTFSAGQLQARGREILGGFLDEEKKAALTRVAMGAITKFGLAFKERKWAPDAADMTVLSNPEGRARTFFSVFPDDTATGPHVLTALMMGTDHRWIRDHDDPQAIQMLLDEIQRVFDPHGPRWTAETVLAGEPDENGDFQPIYFRQDWERDIFALGGNSYLRYVPPEEAVLRVTKARQALRNSRWTLPVFWAGEATAPAADREYQPLAVHGAYISGKRAAEDIHHWLTVSDDNPKEFDRYYRTRYTDRGFFEKVGDFFGDLLG